MRDTNSHGGRQFSARHPDRGGPLQAASIRAKQLIRVRQQQRFINLWNLFVKLQRADFIELVRGNVPTLPAERLEAITAEDTLEDVGIDSLGFATLLFAIEEKLDTRIDERLMDRLNGRSTIADLMSVIRASGHDIEV